MLFFLHPTQAIGGPLSHTVQISWWNLDGVLIGLTDYRIINWKTFLGFFFLFWLSGEIGHCLYLSYIFWCWNGWSIKTEMIRNSLQGKSVSSRRSSKGNVKGLMSIIRINYTYSPPRNLYLVTLCLNHFDSWACRTKRSWSRPKRTLVFDTLWSELTKRYQHIPSTAGMGSWCCTDAKFPFKCSSLFSCKRNHWSH